MVATSLLAALRPCVGRLAYSETVFRGLAATLAGKGALLKKPAWRRVEYLLVAVAAILAFS